MFYVNKHKTMYKYGPAVITLTPTEFEWLSTYVEKVRPQVSPDENVFLSWTKKTNWRQELLADSYARYG